MDTLSVDHQRDLEKAAEKYSGCTQYTDRGERPFLLKEAFLAGARHMEAELLRERERSRGLAEWLEFTLYAAEYLYKVDRPLEPNMAPLFYFTLTYEGDKELIEKTKRAREILAAYRASAKEGEKE